MSQRLDSSHGTKCIYGIYTKYFWMIIRLWKNMKYQMKHNEILHFCLHWNTLSNLLFHSVSLLIFLKDLLCRKLQNQQFMSLQTLQSKLMLTLSHLSSEMERKTKCIFHSELENLLSVHKLNSSSSTMRTHDPSGTHFTIAKSWFL